MEKPLLEIANQVPLEHINKRVVDYISTSGTWDWESLEQLLPHEVLLHLAAFMIHNISNEKDEIVWSKSSSGKFTTKSAFLMLSPVEINSEYLLLKGIWKLQIRHRIQAFAWLVLQNKILTNEERHRSHLIDYTNCVFCPSASETTIHTLRDCAHSLSIWRMEEWWQLNLKCYKKGDENVQWNVTFCCTIWFIWKWRNMRIFQSDSEIPLNKGASSGVSWKPVRKIGQPLS